ncbi:Ribonuclease 3 [termite gut metagenome]|uniref:Ribonuclease 3 n=1 Tax=termite gut metagenome TaxID=433724 RepID=A0A5J4QWH9_9ZZZZ
MLCDRINRIRLLFCRDKEPYLCLYKILGFYPRNLHFYKEALLHKSISALSEKGRPLNNERLEFLGDAILDAIVADILYTYFEGKKEGFLTNTRSKIVQRETLNQLAVKIGLDKLIKSSTHSSSHNNYLHGNAFEAFIGAIYMDRGYEQCKKFIEKQIIKPYINLDELSRREVNFKSKLIEWSQKYKISTSFELVEQFFDDKGDLIFRSEILLGELSAGVGLGYSKKESQQNAARMALKKIKTSRDFVLSILETKEQKDLQEEETPIEQQPEMEICTEEEEL